MTFGQRLKMLRLNEGLSQAKLAVNLDGISQTYLSALEKRETAPRQEILEKLGRYFCVPIFYWYGDTLPTTVIKDTMRDVTEIEDVDNDIRAISNEVDRLQRKLAHKIAASKYLISELSIKIMQENIDISKFNDTDRIRIERYIEDTTP